MMRIGRIASYTVKYVEPPGEYVKIFVTNVFGTVPREGTI